MAEVAVLFTTSALVAHPTIARSTAYSVGNYVLGTANSVLRCVQAGTTASGSWQITNYALTPDDTTFPTNTDGSVIWRDVTGNSFYGWAAAVRDITRLQYSSVVSGGATARPALIGSRKVLVDSNSSFTSVGRFFRKYENVAEFTGAYGYTDVGLDHPNNYVEFVSVDRASPSYAYLRGADWTLTNYISGQAYIRGFDIVVSGPVLLNQDYQLNTRNLCLVWFSDCTLDLTAGRFTAKEHARIVVDQTAEGPAQILVTFENTPISLGNGNYIELSGKHVYDGVTFSRSDRAVTFPAAQTYAVPEFIGCTFSGMPAYPLFDLRQIGYRRIRMEQCVGLVDAHLPSHFDYDVRPYVLEVIGGALNAVIDPLRYLVRSNKHQLTKQATYYRVSGAVDAAGVRHAHEVVTSPLLSPGKDVAEVFRTMVTVPDPGYYRVSVKCALPTGSNPTAAELWCDTVYQSQSTTFSMDPSRNVQVSWLQVDLPNATTPGGPRQIRYATSTDYQDNSTPQGAATLHAAVGGASPNDSTYALCTYQTGAPNVPFIGYLSSGYSSNQAGTAYISLRMRCTKATGYTRTVTVSVYDNTFTHLGPPTDVTIVGDAWTTYVVTIPVVARSTGPLHVDLIFAGPVTGPSIGSDMPNTVTVDSPYVDSPSSPAFSQDSDAWVLPAAYTPYTCDSVGYSAVKGSVLVSVFSAMADTTLYLCPKIEVERIG